MPCVGSKKRHSLYLNPVIVDTFSFFFSPSLVYYMLWSNIWNNIWMKKRVPVALSDEWKLWYQHHLFFRQEASLCFVLAHDPQYTFHSLPWKNRIPSFFVCVFDLIFDLLHTIVRLFFFNFKKHRGICVCVYPKKGATVWSTCCHDNCWSLDEKANCYQCKPPPLGWPSPWWVRRPLLSLRWWFSFFFYYYYLFSTSKNVEGMCPFFFLLLFLSFKSHTFEKKTKFTITLIDDGDLWNCEADANDVTQFFWSKLLYTIPEMDTLQ